MGLLEDLLRGGLGGGAPQTAPPPSMGQRSAGGSMGPILMALLPVVLSMLSRRGQTAGPSPGQLAPSPGGGLGGGGGLGDVLGGVLGGGGLGNVLGQVLGGGAGTGGGGGGLLGGLLRQFDQAGFGQQALSWIGTGANEPIPADAIHGALGPDTVAEIARQAGLSEQETSQGLAHLLPAIIDHVTPDGQLPDERTLASSVDALAAQLDAGGGGGWSA